jgi:hypothetical protein
MTKSHQSTFSMAQQAVGSKIVPRKSRFFDNMSLDFRAADAASGPELANNLLYFVQRSVGLTYAQGPHFVVFCGC